MHGLVRERTRAPLSRSSEGESCWRIAACAREGWPSSNTLGTKNRIGDRSCEEGSSHAEQPRRGANGVKSHRAPISGISAGESRRRTVERRGYDSGRPPYPRERDTREDTTNCAPPIRDIPAGL